MQALRLGLVSFAWTKQHNGGLRSHVRDIAHKLSEFGVNVHVFCVNTDPSAKPFETCSWREEGIQVESMNYAHQNFSCLLDFQRVPEAETSIIAWATNYKLDLIDFHHTMFIGIRAISALSELCPIVATLHDYWPLDPHCQLYNQKSYHYSPSDNSWWNDNINRTWPLEASKSNDLAFYYRPEETAEPGTEYNAMEAWIRFSKSCLEYCRTLITPSQASKKVFQLYGISQEIQVIENGIPTDGLYNQIKMESPRRRMKSKKIDIALLGNVAQSKGQLSFCEACTATPLSSTFTINIHGSFPDTHHGDTSQQDKLKKICQENPDLFRIHGPYDRSDLNEILAETDIVAMPSLWEEVYGLVAREAYCYGIPLITTNAGALAQLLDKEKVFILDRNYPDQWSTLLTEALQSGPIYKWVYERRLQRPPKDNSVESIESCSSKILNVYKNIISQYR